MHAKYEVSIPFNSKVIAKVKVDHRQTDKLTDRQKTDRQDKNNMPLIIRSGGINKKILPQAICVIWKNMYSCYCMSVQTYYVYKLHTQIWILGTASWDQMEDIIWATELLVLLGHQIFLFCISEKEMHFLKTFLNSSLSSDHYRPYQCIKATSKSMTQ